MPLTNLYEMNSKAVIQIIYTVLRFTLCLQYLFNRFLAMTIPWNHLIKTIPSICRNVGVC